MILNNSYLTARFYRFFIYFLLTINILSSYAQSEICYLNQLAVLDVNEIAQIDKSTMWLATETGTYKYDYTNFEKIDYVSKSQDFNYQTLFVKINNKTRDVFSFSANGIIYKYNIHKNYFEEVYRSASIKEFEIVDNENLLILENNSCYILNIRNHKKLNINTRGISLNTKIDFINRLFKIDNKIFLILEDGMYEIKKNLKIVKIKNWTKQLETIKINNESYFSYDADETTYYIFSKNHKLIKTIKINSNPVFPLIFEVEGGLLVKDENLILHKENIKTELRIMKNEFSQNSRASKFHIDLSGNLWLLGRFFNLVNYKSNLIRIHSNNIDEFSKVDFRYAVKNKLLLSNSKKDFLNCYIYEINDDKIDLITPKDNIHKAKFGSYVSIYDTKIVSYSNTEIEKITNNKKYPKSNNIELLNKYLINNKLNILYVEIPEDLIIVLTIENKIIIFDQETQKFETIEILPNNNFSKSDYKYIGNELYLLTSKNLFICNYRNKTFQLYELPKEIWPIVTTINDFHLINNHLIIATKDNEIKSINLMTSKIETILNFSEPIYSIFLDKKKRFWFQSNGTMFVYDFYSKQVNLIQFSSFENEFFFPKNAYNDQVFYTFTDNHFLRVDTEKFNFSNRVYDVFLSKILYTKNNKNFRMLNNGSYINFPKQSFKISLFFSSPDYIYNKFKNLSYRINDEQWRKMNTEIIVCPYKDMFGEFVVQIRDDLSNKIIVEKTIFVEPKFSQTIYFKLLIILLISLMVFVFIKSNRESFKKDLALKNSIENTKIKQKILAKVSHEIRTPLNVIIGFSEMLKNSDKKPVDIEKYSEAIFFAGNSLLNLINDFLSKSAIDANKVFFDKKPFDLIVVLEKIKVFFSLKILEKNLSFHLIIDDRVPKKLVGDINILTQILINLIQNAIKFTDKGSIRLEVNIISLNDNKCILKFDVIDSGMGIPKEKHHKIFEEFSQINNNSEQEGSGLGLMITKELVQVCGGEIYFESEIHNGATFTIELPFDILDETSQKDMPIEEEIIVEDTFDFNQAFHILIAEDEHYNTILLNNILKNKFPNVEIDNVENGLLAIEYLEKKTYHVVILDLNMPYLSGIEVAKHLRKNMIHSDKNLIVCSATSDDDLTENINLYFDYTHPKPYNKEALVDTIKSILAKQNIKKSNE